MKTRELLIAFLANDLFLLIAAVMLFGGFRAGTESTRAVAQIVPASIPVAAAAPIVQTMPVIALAQTTTAPQQSAPPKPYSLEDVYSGCENPDNFARLKAEPELAYEAAYVGLPAPCVAALKLDFDYKVGVHYGWTYIGNWEASYALRANHFARSIGAPQPCRDAESDRELPCLYTQVYRVALRDLSMFNEIGQGKYHP